MPDKKRILNSIKASLYKDKYKKWKKYSLQNEGYFPVFSGFKEKYYLRNLSGGAVKLYIYLGLASKSWTGETWVSLTQMAAYFQCSKRTINNWLKELQELGLVKRMQLELDGPCYSFLQPYGEMNDFDGEDN